jgi:multicomponent Na+:H+ antiporter subunit B
MFRNFINAQDFNLLLINICCFIIIIISFQVARTQKLFLNIVYLSIFSLILCLLYLALDAPDVAMTEAALGASLTTIIFLNVLKKIKTHSYQKKIALKQDENKNLSNIYNYTPLVICIMMFMILIFGFFEIADFGIKSNLSNNVSDYYINNTKKEIGIDSFVAAILANYRGFDTLYETCLIFLAGISVSFILARGGNNNEK